MALSVFVSNVSFDICECNSSWLLLSFSGVQTSLRLLVIAIFVVIVISFFVALSLPSLLRVPVSSSSPRMNVVKPNTPWWELAPGRGVPEDPIVGGTWSSEMRLAVDFQRPSFWATVRNNGRIVPKLPAVIASPCSIVDQTGMSIVDPGWN